MKTRRMTFAGSIAIPFCLAGLMLAIGSPDARGVTPTPAELERTQHWAVQKFHPPAGGESVPPPAAAGLVVLANHDPVQLNNRAGKLMNIGGVEYRRGLYCHAISEIVVRLPAPGRRFTSAVGLDLNDDTRGKNGSVVFSVDVAGKSAFRSEVMHAGEKGVAVDVDLNGASSFTLNISDAGDGISCDQGDWADAKVVLGDGKELWLADLPLLAPDAPREPFSFRYGGRPSAQLLPGWKVSRAARELDEMRTQLTTTWTDPDTGLEVRCVGLQYHDFPAVEWTVFFQNGGRTDTPVLEAVEGLDVQFSPAAGGTPPARGDFLLHHSIGSPNTPTDYRPLETPLGRGASAHVTTSGGRPTNSDMPNFNIAWEGGGAIAVIGWPGQWAADFLRDGDASLHVRGGQELTHFTLHPGEAVRGPLSFVLFYDGDWVRGQNLFRRWMVEHNTPPRGGKPPTPTLFACSSHQFAEMIHADEQNQKLFIDRYLEEGLKIDYWWMDAGWYPQQNGWYQTGNWEVDRKRFPNGLRAVSDHAHAKGVKIIVWFEPERVGPGTWLSNERPQWIYGGAAGGLFKMGEPDARRWMTDRVDKLLTDERIDFYRQDFNMDPLESWRKNDAPDRQGINEIRHVEGYLAYWDELRRRHPDLPIDSCASGGRRNDLETLRRAVPNVRSDTLFEPVSQQCHMYGCAMWIPFAGTGTIAGPSKLQATEGLGAVNSYAFRSHMAPSMTACWDVRSKDLDYDMLRKLVGQWREVAPNYLGDYYPLTPYSTEPTAWMAWQFDRPEAGGGMVQAFRRPGALDESLTVKLHGLQSDASYSVRNLDAPAASQISGREMMDKGLTVMLPSKPAAAVVTYERLK